MDADEYRNMRDFFGMSENKDAILPYLTVTFEQVLAYNKSRNTSIKEQAERKARVGELKLILKAIPALDKHSGESWYRGYVSAQQKLREKVKRRIATLHSTNNLSVKEEE